MMHLPDAHAAFVFALEREIEAVRSEDVSLSFTPTRLISSGYTNVYYGVVEDEFNMPDGMTVDITIAGKKYPAEVIASEDFSMVIATASRLTLHRQYLLSYNLAWLLEALKDWLTRIDPYDDRPIAQGVLSSCEEFHIRHYDLKKPLLPNNLNEYQERAVRQSLSTNLTFIWGPPGTGKSHTISQVIINLLANGKTVLFVSQSNVAVDIVAEKVVSSSAKEIRAFMKQDRLLRAGYPTKESLLSIVPHNIVLKNAPDLAKYQQVLVEKKKELMRKIKEGAEIDVDIRIVSAMLDYITDLVQKQAKELEQRASFIATTLAKLSLNEDINSRTFDAVVVDEASMIGVPSVFAALTLARSHGVVAGDFFQLQPICRSQNARVQKWLGQSVFESAGIRDKVLMHRSDPRLVTLRRQYRMADEISGLANALFYGGILENALPDQRKLLPFRPEERLTLVDISGLTQCYTESDTKSRVNRRSAVFVSSVASLLSSNGYEVAIITPYRAQVREIRKNLTPDAQKKVQVSTVHKFQGSERDIIIFEIPDARPQRAPSILVSGSRETFLKSNSPTFALVNVALTRARSQIIVFADRNFLRSRLTDTSIVLTFIERIIALGTYMRADGTVTQGSRTYTAAASVETVDKPQPRSEPNTAKAREQLSCRKCGSATTVKSGYSFYLKCNDRRCGSNRTMRDEDLLALLLIKSPQCPDCGSPIRGEIVGQWPELYCTNCHRRLSRRDRDMLLLGSY